MKPQGKIMTSFLLSQPVLDSVVHAAYETGISQSEIIEKIILQWSQMTVTGVIEEVTEKDVFEDINRELQKIDARLSWIEGRLTDIDIATAELK